MKLYLDCALNKFFLFLFFYRRARRKRIKVPSAIDNDADDVALMRKLFCAIFPQCLIFLFANHTQRTEFKHHH